MLSIPGRLQHLLNTGRWPRNRDEAARQNIISLVPVARIKQLAPEEDMLYLFAPPFHTVAERSVGEKFWFDQRSAPSEIDFELSLEIGDFGLGSDAPILLDYRLNRLEPRVIRLRWSNDGTDNHWIEAAPNFETFAEILGLNSAS